MTRLRLLAMACIDGVRRLWLRVLGVRTRTIETSQGRLRFLESEGTGPLPPILLIHGLSAGAIDWGPVLRRLRKACMRVRAIDLPGHGWSDTPVDGMGIDAIREMILQASDTFLDQPHIILGNSLGGLAAVRIAAQKPDMTLALVLVSPGGTPIPQEDLDTLMDSFEMNTWARTKSFVDRCLGGHSQMRIDLMWAVRARVGRPSIKALIAGMSREDLLTPDELTQLHMPTLLYWGQDDEILAEPHLEFFSTHLHSSTEICTPAGVGHAPFLDDVEHFVSVVLEFCEGLPFPGYPSASSHK